MSKFGTKTSSKEHDCTEEEYNKRWKDQEGRCCICDIEMIEDGQKYNSVHIDHCHTSGETRGLLCKRCNIGLGHFKDSPERLIEAAKYLEAHRKTSYWWKMFLG